MARIRLSPRALQDVDSILNWTWQQFGEPARDRYLLLLEQALIDVASDPKCPGVGQCEELGSAILRYHIKNSRSHVTNSAARVQSPRHFLLYRIAFDGTIEVGRILHDSVDLNRHLPDNW